VAAVWDVREYRIPNGCLAVSLVSGAAAAFGVSGAAFGGMAASSAGGLPFSIVVLSGFLIRFLMVVALGFPVYRWGMIGAGDVKMAAVLAAWLGFKDGAAGINAGFAGGIMRGFWGGSRSGSWKNAASGQYISEVSLFIRLYQAKNSVWNSWTLLRT